MHLFLERDGFRNDDDCDIGDDQKETMGEQVPLMHCPLLRHLKLETAQPDHRDGDELMITMRSLGRLVLMISI